MEINDPNYWLRQLLVLEAMAVAELDKRARVIRTRLRQAELSRKGLEGVIGDIPTLSILFVSRDALTVLQARMVTYMESLPD